MYTIARTGTYSFCENFAKQVAASPTNRWTELTFEQFIDKQLHLHLHPDFGLLPLLDILMIAIGISCKS